MGPGHPPRVGIQAGPLTPRPRTPELTFILLSGESLPPLEGDTVPAALLAGQPMIGDVNLFMKGAPADEDFEAEAEIMIAGASPLPRSSNHSGHVSLTRR